MSLMLARLTGKPIKEVRDEHFRTVGIIQSEFRGLSEQFEKDVTDSVMGTREGPGELGFSSN